MERLFDCKTSDLNNSGVFQLSRSYCSEDIVETESENMHLAFDSLRSTFCIWWFTSNCCIRILVVVYLPGPGPTLQQLAKNVGEGVWSSKAIRTEITKWIMQRKTFSKCSLTCCLKYLKFTFAAYSWSWSWRFSTSTFGPKKILIEKIIAGCPKILKLQLKVLGLNPRPRWTLDVVEGDESLIGKKAGCTAR